MTVAAPPLPLQALLDIGHGLAAAAPHSARLSMDASAPTRGFLRLLATDAYEAWLLAWPPGSEIEPHDHGGSHGVFVVVAGNLTESRWHGGERRRRVLGPGEAASVSAGAVHGVAARGKQPALSVHVYSPPLTEMRFYGDDGTTLVGVEAVDAPDEAPSRG